MIIDSIKNFSKHNIDIDIEKLKYIEGKHKIESKQEIYAIWEARNKQLCSGSTISIVFSGGVLKAFRYGVGDSGISNETERRQILDHVLEAPIPPVKDKSYTLEWGKPRSLKRKEKLIRTLRGLIAAKERMTSYHKSSFNRAVQQWKDDLSYLTSNLA